MGNYILDKSGLRKTDAFEAHKQPEFKIKKQVDWVLWGFSTDWSDIQWNNRQPDYYDWLYDSSSKNRAILNTKTFFITGKGLDLEGENALTLQDRIESLAFLKKLNKSEFVKNISKDWTRYGGFCYEVVFSNDSEEVIPYHVPFGKVRRSKPEYTDGKEDPITYYFTRDWSSRKPQNNPDWTTFEEVPEDPQKNRRYLVYYKDEESLYPLPEYTAAVPYIAADYEVGNFVYNNTASGFASSYLVEFHNGEPTEEQKAQVEAAWKKSKHGSDNAGEPILSFAEAGDQGINITALPSNGQDDRYINLNKQIREEIFSGHTIDPIVAGLKGETGFSNNADEKRVAIEAFQSYYVEPHQRVIEDHINTIMDFNLLKGKAFIPRLDPIQAQVSEAELASILTIDERRARAGFAVSETESNKVADALATISPLVATKVLEAMSLEEIRAIVGLTTDTPIERVTETLKHEYSKKEDDSIIEFLSECGELDDNFEVIAEKEIHAFSIEEAESQAAGFKFATLYEQTILDLLDAGSTVEEIAELTQTTVEEVEEAIASLEEEGLVEEGEVTEKGQEEREREEIMTVYKYVKRIDASGPADLGSGRTRDFCHRMLRLSEDRSWTIEQIKRLNNGQGLDVFTSRGGWYRLPNGASRPSCRHVWSARLVKRKNL